jgi:hypothetical protein
MDRRRVEQTVESAKARRPRSESERACLRVYIRNYFLDLGLIRFRGHFLEGESDVQNRPRQADCLLAAVMTTRSAHRSPVPELGEPRIPPSPHVSTTQGEVRASARTQEELADGSKRRQLNRLRPQLARRQLVTQTHPFGFDSRRLHHSTRSRCSLARGVGAVVRQVSFGLRPRLTGSTPAASNSHNLFTGSRLRAGAVPACTCGVPKYQHSDRRRAFGMERLHAAAPGDSIKAVWLSPRMNGGI